MLNNPVAGKENSQKADVNSSETKQKHASGEHGMYSSITIENFRLFEHIELDDLARVNLFFGPNNCGKTSILEAFYTHAAGLDFGPIMNEVVIRRRMGLSTGLLDWGEQLVSLFRDRSSVPYTFTISAQIAEDPSPHRFTATFHPSSQLADLDPRVLGQSIENASSVNSALLSSHGFSEDDFLGTSASPPTSSSRVFLGVWRTEFDREQRDVRLIFPKLEEPLLIQTQFKLARLHDVLSHRHPNSETRVFSHLKRYGILDEFIEEMDRAFPGIRKIDMFPYPDGTPGPVYIEIREQRLPLYVTGDGMRRWYYLLGHMLVFRDALHCIEEIDFGFHPDAQQKLSRLLIRYAEKFGNQLLLTSHSIEFADAFLEAFYGEDGMFASSDEDPVRVFTIRPTRDFGRPEIWKLTGREAYKNRSYYDLELR